MLETPTTSGTIDTTSQHITRAGWRIVLLASLGGTLEFYDFVIFGVFARDIAQAIFPSTSPIVSLMASFAAFAAGYLARPLGGIILSHYGDRYGRRRVFIWSVFVMSAATLGMGLVPDYAQAGVAASVPDGCLTADSGLLPRRRAARRADLRGRNGAEDCAAGVRGGLLMRHARRRRGHRSEPGDPHVSRSGARAAVRLARGVHFGRTRRRADLRAPALARGIARVRANAQPRVAAAVSGVAADSSGAGGGRVRVARRDRLLQWPLLLAPTRILVGRSSIRPTRGGVCPNHRRDRLGRRHPVHGLDRGPRCRHATCCGSA